MDWIDILTHAAVSLIVVGLAGMAGYAWLAAAGNAVFWLGRELWQHRGFGGLQSQLEWLVPGATGFALAGVLGLA